MHTIGVLTSGGDAPGMNAAIRAVARSADARGMRTLGVEDGYQGLIEGRLVPLDARSVSGILHSAGTMLGSARCDAFRGADGRRDAAKVLDAAGVEGLVVIGGDGSLFGANLLQAEAGVPVVGIPGTIDNDLSGTDYTLGFDTAVNTALESIDRVRDTASSHRRLFFVEVMGRHSGWIAAACGLTGGATEVLAPEAPADFDALRERIRGSFDLGKRFCLVIVAEGGEAGGAYDVARTVTEGGLDVDHRVVALGHVQRGGPPSMRDRLLGSVLGDAAVTALLDGDTAVMVGEHHGAIIRTSLEHTWTVRQRRPDDVLALMRRLAR